MKAPKKKPQKTQHALTNAAGLEGTSSLQVAELPETTDISLGNSAFISYSINFEDVILNRLFSKLETGFYVDVGAEHPRLGNDMFALYQRGWRGINIEPNHRYHALLTAERPRDINLRVALSDRLSGELTFYELNGSGLSTCDPEQGKIYQESGRDVIIRNVPVMTLSAVLAEADITHINILKVDVEGFEEKVLKGNDWKRFRPDVVVVEATFPNSPIRRPTDILNFMEQQGYRHVHFDGLNDFYLEREFATPDGLTLPPNFFDRFVLLETLDLRNHVASLQTQFIAAEGYAQSLQSQNADLQKQFIAAEGYAQSLQSQNADLQKQFIAAEGYAQSLQSQNADLRRNADALATESRRVGHENAQLSFENHRLRKAAEQMRNELLTLNRLLEPLHAMSEQLERRDAELREVRASMSEQLERRDVELREVRTRMSEQLHLRVADVEQLNRRIADAESSIEYVSGRRLFEKLFFRLDGRPTKPLRRLLFHTSGAPRPFLRVLVHHKNGAPRSAFVHWMGSREYLGLPSAVKPLNH